ncbi:MAG: hypothetical protein M3R70_05775 [Actinomycetota bacterium]|nr:hypothetical protein [Actinomycetota bacterium]
MRRTVGFTSVFGALALLLLVLGGTAAARPENKIQKLAGLQSSRGDSEYGGRNFGSFITECPQAGQAHTEKPLDRRQIDAVEQLSSRGDDLRANTDYACVPQNETSIAVNPRNERNVIGGANDYQGEYNHFYASTSKGRGWYDTSLPNPSNPEGYNLTQSDPVVTYDRDGIAYNAEIAYPLDDSGGVFVWRSTNGGFTQTRPCVPIDTTPSDPNDDAARCGGVGDPRQPGDGVVTWNQDPDLVFNGDTQFDDKEWIAAGPRPTGVAPQCFGPITHNPVACQPGVVGSDRLYMTWTRFDVDGTGKIMISYSDDQARSWSAARAISGSAAFCKFGTAADTDCDQNQFSVPTVHPKTGLLGVAFENFNTPHENQYLFVRSRDGAQTFEGPFFVSSVFDANYPRGATRPDCRARGQSNSRAVLTNSCFRVNSGGNVVIDKRGGAFADDFYLTLSDNRNGTPASSNTDVFFFRTTDGGSTWVGPTRVNNDRSVPPADRDAATMGNFGNDQWFPWIDVNADGVLGLMFFDRRLDEDSMASEWPASRQRAGNYLTWAFGAGCRITVSGSRQCLAPSAAVIPQPTAPVDPGSGPVPGQGPGYLGPFANQVLSDVPSNMDYAFRAGLFLGDYNNVAYPNFPQLQHHSDHAQAVALWTDARNGRGSGGPNTTQPGRNPPCEQSDAFLDFFNPLRSDLSDSVSDSQERLFLVTPCPRDSDREHRG